MKNTLIYLLAVFITLFESCSGRNEEKHNCGNYDNEALISKAERFIIEKRNGFTRLTITDPWQGARNISYVYNLVPEGTVLPEELDSSMIISVPVEKIICMSTTYVSMISALGEENTISGVSGREYIYSAGIQRNIKMELIEDVGYETSLNKELILKISPDLVMMYGIGSESSGYVAKLMELGVPVMFNADYLETDPLSKAEWIKVFGALYCKERMADSIYNIEVDSYNSLQAYVSENISERPKVLLGLPFKDTWFVSPGNSFISKLIADAGGDYLWHDTESALSMPFGIENVYLKAITADYWLNIGSVITRDEISLFDRRLTELPCFKNGNLYNNNKRITDAGGNDYWESGSVYPHIILRDIASILHPDLFVDNELFFYRKIY